MKTQQQLQAKIESMTIDQLRDFAYNIVYIVYGEYDPMNDQFVFDQDKEWEGDTLEFVAESIVDAGLDPANL